MKKLAIVGLSLLVVAWSNAIEGQQVKVVVNGAPVAFPDVQPLKIRNRVMVPLRGVFEHIGATIDWIPTKNLVRAMRGDTKIECWINKIFAAVDDDQVKLDVPPMIVAGRTLVPLRFFAEALGAEVRWDGATSTVEINLTNWTRLAKPDLAGGRCDPVLHTSCHIGFSAHIDANDQPSLPGNPAPKYRHCGMLCQHQSC